MIERKTNMKARIFATIPTLFYLVWGTVNLGAYYATKNYWLGELYKADTPQGMYDLSKKLLKHTIERKHKDLISLIFIPGALGKKIAMKETITGYFIATEELYKKENSKTKDIGLKTL